MEEIIRKTLTTKDDQTIYYELYFEGGKGPDVLFVHGLGGDTDAWQFIRDRLRERGVSSMALDLRGHGYSSHPRSPKSYRMEHFVGDILAVLDAETIEKIILVGHSWGAVVATYVALHHPERLRKVAIISGAVESPWYMRLPVLRWLINAGIHAAAYISPPPLQPGHSRYPAGKFHKDTEWWGLTRTTLRNSLHSYLLTAKLLMGVDLESKLGNIKVPTLIMAGDADTIFPFSSGERLHAGIGGSRFKAIPGGNHVLVLNNIEEVSDELYDFIKEQ